jgi:hypothetical protein
MFYGITLIILGLLASPSLLLSKKPNAKELLDKIVPYQGWIGVVFAFYGVWGIIQAVINIGLLTSHPIWWITWVACVGVEAALGFLLGFGLLSKYFFSKNETAKQKSEELLAKLAPKQGFLGLVAIGLGIWGIIASIIFF